MFPQCANAGCTASFRNLRDGKLYRFHRPRAGNEAPPNSHFVEHAWLCAKCCEGFTLEYRDDRPVVRVMPPLIPVTSIQIPRRKRRRGTNALRPSRSRRTPIGSTAGAPVVLVSITPAGDFPDRK